MEHLTYEVNNQKKIERFLLFIYSIYNVNMIVMAIKLEWDSWVGLFLVGMLTGCLVFYISKYKTYTFRARFSAMMMLGSVILFATQMDELSDVLPIFMAFTVFIGFYGISDVIYVSTFSALFIFFYHGVIVDSIFHGNANEVMTTLAQLGNVLLLQYVVYVWTKKNSEGSRQLLEIIEVLQAVENHKDDFLANVSHEIRTPINTICGMSELVLLEELPENIKENLMGIQSAGKNLMSVVSDIVDFSELQSGNIELEEEAYNITSTLNDVINMTLARKNEKKIELIVDCDPNIPSALLGDEKKLRRVIMNLMDNAVKFTEEGCVTIAVGYRRETYGINLIFTVKDTGIGMDEKSVEKLFTSFSQVNTATNRQEGGVGLGLAISLALVKKMGGALTVKSKLGKGSVVKFVVPQKVLDETPIAALNDKENVKVATYIDMEQFDMVAIRDEYSNMIQNMVKQLRGRCHICRNLAELQRRERQEHFTHIFISIVEYQEDIRYFDSLAQKTNVIVVLDRSDDKQIVNSKLYKIYEPFYILTIVSVLNGLEDVKNGKPYSNMEKFVTKDVHVLVVDDNRMNIRVIEGLLENYKIKVSIAISGQEALERIASADYDFVFMDHMMPEMDGVETMHRIRHKVGTYYQKVPIVALTANAVAGTREMLLKEGFDDFLEKPVERSVLERVLKRNLPADKIVCVTRDKGVMAEREQVKKGVMNHAAVPKDTAPKPEPMEELLREGLDVEKGMLYCNGREQYLKVLQGYCQDFDDVGTLAQQLFEKQDWKNYVIAVHGIKSAMRSIGAMQISEIARMLELAGREERISYILEHHQELQEEYRGLFTRLQDKDWLLTNKKQKDKVLQNADLDMGEIEKEALEQKLADMEAAMYELDGERLAEILVGLENYQYDGIPMRRVCASAKRKVEMSDYVSAVEMVKRWKRDRGYKESS